MRTNVLLVPIKGVLVWFMPPAFLEIVKGVIVLDNLDRMLLDRIQRSFPLVTRPYHELSSGLGITAGEVMERLWELKERRLLRQISGIFNTGALGYKSSLVAMAVDEANMEKAAGVVNSYEGVSHNYLRPGRFNMWFTIAVPPADSLEGIVHTLARDAGGCETLILPALKKYKLAVVLDVLEESDPELSDERFQAPLTEALEGFEAGAANIAVVRCVQEDLPLRDEPFHAWADILKMEPQALLDLISLWLRQGFMRRFAAVLNHRQVGFKANGMVVWRCPEAMLDKCGNILASHAEVSHCYHRPAYPEWPFNLYAMIHGRSVEECKKVAEKLADAIDVRDYDILFSTHEFKKTRLKLFWSQ